jgi:hypothetical protein
MKDHPLSSYLKQLADQHVPEPNLWPAIQTQLNNPISKPGLQVLRLLMVGMAALGLVFVLAATPWGQAMAQSLLLFFTPAASESYPVTVPSIVTTIGIEPTRATDTITGCEQDSEFPVLYCQSIAQAEAVAGFDVKEPTTAPFELDFAHASVDTELHKVAQVYTCPSMGCQFFISQASGPQPASDWDEVPVDYVEVVQINGMAGEYVAGGFVMKAGATEVTWEPGTWMQRLRWREGDYQFEIAAGGPFDVDKASLVALAESLVVQP